MIGMRTRGIIRKVEGAKDPSARFFLLTVDEEAGQNNKANPYYFYNSTRGIGIEKEIAMNEHLLQVGKEIRISINSMGHVMEARIDGISLLSHVPRSLSREQANGVMSCLCG